jgi:hypothetical protein
MSIEVLNQVLAAGEAAGYWKTLPNEWAEPHMQHSRCVEGADKRRFELSTHGGKINARVAALSSIPRARGIRVMVNDMIGYRDVAPCASSSATQPPEAIAKSLNRRVIADPDAQKVADKVRAELIDRIEKRVALLSQVEKMKAMGCGEIQHQAISDSTYYEAYLWRQGTGTLRVVATGHVYLERVTFAVDDMPAIFPLMK